MSTSLPQEVQTQKVKTLPDDLKKLAEELLGEKFGEEVIEVEQPRASFPGDRAPGVDSCGDPGCTSCYGPGGGRFDRAFDPRRSNIFSIVTVSITLEACYELLKRVENEYGPSFARRADIVWRMGRREFDDLIRDRRSDSAMRFGPRPQLFGIEVTLEGESRGRIMLEARY